MELQHPQRTVSQAIADELRVMRSHVFGVVGNGNIHLVSALPATIHRYTSARHEGGAVAAADAYFRASGKVAIATSTYGPGFTNTLTALAELQAARIPMVLVLGDIPTSGPRNIDVDQQGLLRALNVHFEVIDAPTATAQTRWAVQQAHRRSAPVVLFIPYDLVDAPLPEQRRLRIAEESEIGSSSQVATDARFIAEQLKTAKNPLILVGRGVLESEMQDVVRRIGDQTGALFMFTGMAANAFSTSWSLGIAGGFTHRGMLATVAEADFVLALGCGLNQFQVCKGSLFSSDATLVHVAIDPREPMIPVDRTLVHDLRDLAPAVEDEIAGTVVENSWRERLGEIPERETEELDPGCFAEVADDGKLDPRFVLRQLNELLPQERTVVTDGGHFLGWVPKYIDVLDPRGLVMVGTAIMTIGLGVPSAAGATIARMDRCTTLFTGDGGALMGIADFETFFRAARARSEFGPEFAGPAAVMIVLNDAAYGAEIHQYVKQGLDEEAMLLEDVDFSTMGQPWGIPGLNVTSPEQLRAGGEVEEFLAAHAGKMCVLDVKISRLPVADFLKE